MREVFNLNGKRQSVDNIEDALRIVRESYPGAMKKGAVGVWIFYIPPWQDDNMVAEAWVKYGKAPGWWLVVKKK